VNAPRQPIDDCETKRGFLALQLHQDCWEVFTHRDCQHNQLRSIYQRVLMPVPVPSRQALLEVREAMMSFAYDIGGVADCSLDEVVSYYPKKKQKKYAEALAELKSVGLIDRDRQISAFIKSERLKISEKDGDPRMIQFRSVKFNLALGRFTRPIEKRLYEVTWLGEKVVMKGYNERDRATCMWRAWQKYANPTAMAFDLSRWDAHCSVELLKVVHEFYLQLNPSAEFADLLTVQLDNKCRTRDGWVYTAPGGVMSGDMTTALGNCVMLCAMVIALMKRLDLELSFLDDGDDHCIIGEEDDVRKYAEQAPQWFEMCGHSLKVEGFAQEFHKILFCQNKPTRCEGRWTLSPDPRKVLSTAFVAPRPSSGMPLEMIHAYLAEIWYMRAILHQGVPILGPLFSRLARETRHLRKDRVHDVWTNMHFLVERLGYDGRSKISPIEIDPEARWICEENYGFSVDEQIVLENMRVPLPAPEDYTRVHRLHQLAQGRIEHSWGLDCGNLLKIA